MIFSLSAWLAAVVHVAARTSRSKAGGLSLYSSDLLGRLQWTHEVGRWALRHRRRPIWVLAYCTASGGYHLCITLEYN